jgi:hypothetical protein
MSRLSVKSDWYKPNLTCIEAPHPAQLLFHDILSQALYRRLDRPQLPVDSDQRGARPWMQTSLRIWEAKMSTADIEILVLAVGAFSLLGGVLGWASWDESRRARRNRG